ncbi:hypothetical protein ACSHWO_02155 [Streptomyces sp. HUAS TT3]|uniref:hypothetical protein n=1 Tax=Streptomyces sp. HUAS TT3 TaxID=3447510 RepID=UPI003F6563E0
MTRQIARAYLVPGSTTPRCRGCSPSCCSTTAGAPPGPRPTAAWASSGPPSRRPTAARLYAEAARKAPGLAEHDHLTRQAARLNMRLRH